MEPAGYICSEQPESADYGKCDGTYVNGFFYPDYRRRCGTLAGGIGFNGCGKPHAPGYSIRLRDDPNLPDPPADSWSIANLPPPYMVFFDPIPDQTTSGADIEVVATGYVKPAVATSYWQLCQGDIGLGQSALVPFESDGTFVFSATVPVGDNFRFELWVADRPDIRGKSDNFQVTAETPAREADRDE